MWRPVEAQHADWTIFTSPSVINLLLMHWLSAPHRKASGRCGYAVHYARQAAGASQSAAPGRRPVAFTRVRALHDSAILPEDPPGFSLCVEDRVSADEPIFDRGCLSGRGSLI